MSATDYDLCIIGAGFFGCAAARHASGRINTKVCLIGLDEPLDHEYQHREIFSSHYDEGRIVKTLFPHPAYQKLAKKSIQLLKDLEKQTDQTFYYPIGFMNVGKKGNKLMRNLEDASSVLGTECINVDEDYRKKIYPFLKLGDDEYGLLNMEGAGIIIARRVLLASKSLAKNQGCHLISDRVLRVSELTGDFHKVVTENHGEIKAKRVLITTGAFANVNNFEILPQLEMYMLKEMATLVRIPDSEVIRLHNMPGMQYKRDEADIGWYILPPVQYPDGKHYLKIGSLMYDTPGTALKTIPEIKEWFTSREKPGETKSMAETLFKMLPGLKSEGLVRKICVTSETPSGYPYIDQVSPTVTVAVAGNGWGATIAEEIGRLAVNLSLKRIWDTDLPHSLFKIIPKERKECDDGRKGDDQKSI